ncbi:MAG: hypothetical protein IJU68_06305 [Bacteroidales bacterium]|nr:hypothetical protein [Bacteroidales bacterium]
MKKYFVVFVAATLAAASCAPEQFEAAIPAGETVRFSISSEETRALLGSDYKICWEGGKDRVSLFAKTDNCLFNVTGYGESFWVEGTIASPQSTYYALYPYDPDATNSTGFLTTTIPSEQKAIQDQFSNIIAVAGTKSDELHFQNCVTLVEADLQTDGVRSISFRGNNGELIAGTVRIAVSTKDDTPPVTTVIKGYKEVSVSNGGAVLPKGKYYLAVIPQVFQRGVTVSLKGDAGEAVKCTVNSVSAGRSRRLRTGPLDMTLSGAGESFCFFYDDGEHSGSIFPGQERTLIYSYSGRTRINYSVISDSGFTQEITGDGLGSGVTAASGSVNLLPAAGSGGDSEATSRLRAAAPRGSKASPIDLSTDNNNTLGAGLTGVNTANCYIVRAPGWYSFPLVYGNAIKNGSPNISAYTASGSGSSVLPVLIDGSGAAIGSPYIKGAVGARIEWQDALGLVSDEVSLDGDKVVFEVPSARIREGNAVLSVLNSEGTVLWSWHIWVSGASDEELKPVSVTNKAGVSYDMMRINLGWVHPCSAVTYESRSTTVRLTENGSGKVIEFTLMQMGASLPANELGNCPFFQWGRKDPFVSSDGTQYTDSGVPAPDNTVNFRKKTWYTGERRDTTGTRAAVLGNDLAAFIRHPSVYNITSGGDNKYVNAWNAAQANLGSTDKVVKTVYDPCPVGFCLPPIAAFTAFSPANTTDGFNHGWTFYAKPDKGGETTFFPACGSMSTSNTTSTSVFGALRNVGFQCSYWSGNPNQLNSAYYMYGTNTSVNTNYGSYRQYVYPIRAAKEK